MKKKIIIPSIIVLVIIGVILTIMLFPKTYTLKNNSTNKISITLRKDKEKKIKLKVEDSNKNIILKNFNNKQNTNYIVYILRKDNKIINKGLIHNTDDTIIPKVEKGEYVLSIIYKGLNKYKVNGKISLKEEEKSEYSTLKSGITIKEKINELLNREYKDYSIKNIKITDKVKEEYINDNYIVSTPESKKPIYMWVEDDTLYFYSENKIEYGEYTSYMFSNLSGLTDASDLKYIKADKVEDMGSMFFQDESLSDIKFLSYYNTPKLETIDSIFWKCYSLIDITPLMAIETNNLEDITSMLEETSVTDISILKYFNTDKLTNIGGFISDTKIVDLTPIKDWNTSKVKNMSGAFSDTKITNVDALKNWDVSKVENMSFIFDCCVELKDINGIRNWNTKSLKSFNRALSYTSLTNLDALSKLNTNKLESFDGAFEFIRTLKDIKGIKNWNTKKIKSFKNLFNYTSITNVDALANWNTSKVTTLEATFSHTKLNNLNGLKKWDVSKVENFEETFSHNKAKDVSGINDWNIDHGTSFENIFYKSKNTPKWNGTFNEEGTFIK